MNEFGGLVWSLARRFTSSSVDAEDAVQEIFLDVWRSAHRFDASVASASTFVAMIARRRLIDRRRKLDRRPDERTIIEESIPARAGGDGRMELDEEASVAAEALEELSEDQRRVLRLSIVHGLSHERIAQATEMPLGTVKTHARRGLIKVREALASRQRRGESEVVS